MEPVIRSLEELTDGTGRVRRSLLRTIEVRDRKELESLLKRLENEQKLLGCAGALCHLEYWTEQKKESWLVTVRSRVLTSLRTHLATRALEQEELIVLPADQKKAEQALRLYRDSIRLPDQEILQLALNVCRGLEMAQKAELQSCQVSLDTIYITADGRWLLGDFFLTSSESPDTEGLALVLHQLLGGSPEEQEPPFGGTGLCLLVKQLRQKAMEPAQLREKLEELIYGRPQAKQEVTNPKNRTGVPMSEVKNVPPQPEVIGSTLKPAGSVVPEKKPEPGFKPVSERNSHSWQSGQKKEKSTENPMPKQKWQSILKKDEQKPTIEDTIRKKVNLSGMISAGDGFTAAVRRNGTVLSTRIFAGLMNWTGIKAVAVGGSHLLGLRQDGRVQVVGNNFHGQCDIYAWNEIVQIAAGMSYSAGLRSDGKLLIAGWVGDKWKHTGQWTDLAAIAAGSQHLVGLRKDGTVIAEGNSQQGQCNVEQWKNIVAVSAGGIHSVGLRADGTVVATGANLYGQCSVQGWTDIIAVDAGADHTVGLKADGTVVATGNFSFGARAVENWRNVIAISAGWSTTVGLTADGKLLATGKNDYGQCDVSHWQGLV